MMVVKPVQVETAEVWAEQSANRWNARRRGLSLVGKQQVERRRGSTGAIYYLKEVS